ncbi:hypothetical protein PHYBLDRAFT_173528 [Phycomyces blakesleeanus NRRL 1555(-)]|uniref:Uncharacterized protein n=1 Tax=Phycomyces blakesleeanus (strain ATCC 8743b / DSM 1359 / FGSC 10004 / NBRC 33097 / NRRL 1555) TaxID=763407 RepID=A0A162NCD8_PHYB8|nr:hypothetical protein PHYBLDRAFT_173528 [Phycomyces blakesleeanus NRRL 1555(-)]OAD68034.1 hypothetical protein PHYBLDRAFT_173528 [Phycomyces blakesleeanus NRRL 1555(-)]|eukprot:XP_018286074.1 hypothetical protein PHYBLDRAFT_173528 [Phycomyces blakesleeanus NRRL 1555(-)]
MTMLLQVLSSSIPFKQNKSQTSSQYFFRKLHLSSYINQSNVSEHIASNISVEFDIALLGFENRLCNRDLVAVLSSKNILNQLRYCGTIPDRLDHVHQIKSTMRPRENVPDGHRVGQRLLGSKRERGRQKWGIEKVPLLLSYKNQDILLCIGTRNALNIIIRSLKILAYQSSNRKCTFYKKKLILC